MLIVSKFHDYYDSAIGYGGVDKTCVFERKIVNVKNDNTFEKFLPKQITSNNTDTICTVFVVGFCGKFYVGCHFTNTIQPSFKNRFKSFCVYGKDEIKKALAQRKIKERGYYYYFFRKKKIFEIIQEFHNKSNLDLFFKYKAPIFGYDKKFVLNPNLKQLEFYKVFDSYSAFQEIHMFLSGVLGNPEKETVKISDMDRLVAKGFDKKTSFRKEKEDK